MLSVRMKTAKYARCCPRAGFWLGGVTQSIIVFYMAQRFEDQSDGLPAACCTTFRRTTPQITNPGGLWDESRNFYARLGGTPHLGTREWRWPRGSKIKFSHGAGAWWRRRWRGWAFQATL